MFVSSVECLKLGMKNKNEGLVQQITRPGEWPLWPRLRSEASWFTSVGGLINWVGASLRSEQERRGEGAVTSSCAEAVCLSGGGEGASLREVEFDIFELDINTCLLEF